MACTMGNACRTAVKVTENEADAVIVPPAANPLLTIDRAALSNPELLALCPFRSLLDQFGGALVSTVLATASFCCSPASAGAMAISILTEGALGMSQFREMLEEIAEFSISVNHERTFIEIMGNITQYASDIGEF